MGAVEGDAAPGGAGKQWEFRGTSGSVRVPTDCSTVVRDEGLADTGGPARWPLGGSMLVVVGAACLIQRLKGSRGMFAERVEAPFGRRLAHRQAQAGDE